ncbi:MAG: helix-turn-helix domain-containing protein [Symploca sp. SIO2C1]|nr:helix-turn-helix domain-containing protein [Symploca sp. SIO2C1]
MWIRIFYCGLSIALKLGKHSQYCHYVEIKGQSRLVYSPYLPARNCRARLWMEVSPTVPVGSSKFETPGGTRGRGDGETGRKESPPQISFTPPGNRGPAVGVPEAAYLLRVSPQRVRQLLNQGRIAGASKNNQRWRIPLGSSGLPQVSAGSRGPKGTWCHPPVQKTIIRINQAKIHTNTASNSCLPVIDIWHNGTVCHCHEVEIMGPSRILYRPHHGGAYSLWIEVATEVKVVGKGKSVQQLIMNNG